MSVSGQTNQNTYLSTYLCHKHFIYNKSNTQTKQKQINKQVRVYETIFNT